MNTRVSIRAGVGVVSWALVVSTAHAQPCVPAWSDQLSLSEFDSWIGDLPLHDDGLTGDHGAYEVCERGIK